MDEIFENILAQLKKLMLDKGITDDVGSVLSDSYDAIAVAYEVSIDRRIEAKVGKTVYQSMLVMDGLAPDDQELMRRALGGQLPREDLPN